MAVEAFGIEKEFLHSLLDEAAEAKAQLRNFSGDGRGRSRTSAACSHPFRWGTQ